MTTTRCLPLLPLLYYRDGGHAEQPYHHEVSALAPPPTPIFPDRLRPRLLSLARRETPQPTPSPPLCEIDVHFSKLACDFPDHSSTRARVASDRRDNVRPVVIHVRPPDRPVRLRNADDRGRYVVACRPRARIPCERVPPPPRVRVSGVFSRT